MKTAKRYTYVHTGEGFDNSWDMIYLDYSHSNKREFEEAEKKARI